MPLFGRRVAPVHEAVDENALDFIFARHAQQREKMLDVRMDAAIADEGRSDATGAPRPRSIASSNSGWRKNSPLAMSWSTRVMSICTMRPAPIFRWPTSLLPICPSGSPT